MLSYPVIPKGAPGREPTTPGAIIPVAIPTPEAPTPPGGVGVILLGESDFALLEDGPSSSSSPIPRNLCILELKEEKELF